MTLMMFILLIFILEWNYFSVRWNTASAYREMLGTALFASDALFTTPGDPPGWERLGNISESSVHAIGLADSRNILNGDKLERLSELNQSDSDYQLVLERLGMPGYQLHFTIMDLTGESVYYEFGRPSALNNSVTIERLVLINQTTAAVAKVDVWR